VVPRITLLVGVLLIIVGAFFYYLTNMASWTALIPAIFGLVFMILGQLAAVPGLRKHMMHVSAALALLGVVFGIIRLLPGPAEGKGYAYTETAIFAGLCGLLVILSGKSFIDARRRRQASA
jgi:hypothetical protein